MEEGVDGGGDGCETHPFPVHLSNLCFLTNELSTFASHFFLFLFFFFFFSFYFSSVDYKT